MNGLHTKLFLVEQELANEKTAWTLEKSTMEASHVAELTSLREEMEKLMAGEESQRVIELKRTLLEVELSRASERKL